ncbi:MAG: hypothetical protein QW390_04325 [Candidatus Bathyarchaeia archaeon]
MNTGRTGRMVDSLPDSSDKIDHLIKQSMEIRSLRNSVIKELEESVVERDRLNQEFQKRKAIIQQLKEKRDAVNLQVQECKKKRNEARQAVQKKREEAKEIQEEISRLKGQFPGEYEDTCAEIKKLEWKIQTECLSQEAERITVSKIANLEAMVKVQKRRHDLKERLKQVRAEIKSLGAEASQHHARLKALVDESENYHRKMLELVNEAASFKDKADKAHQSFVDAKNRANELQQQITLLTNQIRDIKKNVDESVRKERLEKEQEIKKRIAESAADKLRRGGRLSFDEFRILVEKGAI